MRYASGNCEVPGNRDRSQKPKTEAPEVLRERNISLDSDRKYLLGFRRISGVNILVQKNADFRRLAEDWWGGGRWGCYLRCRLDSTSLPMGCYLRCRLDSTSLRGGGDVTYDAGWTVPVSGEVGMLLTMQAGQYQSPGRWGCYLRCRLDSTSLPMGCYLRCRLDSTSLRGGGDVTYDAGWTVPVSGEVGMLLTMQAGQYQSPDGMLLTMQAGQYSTSLRGGGDVTYDAGWTVPVSGEVGMLLTMQAGQYQSPDGMLLTMQAGQYQSPGRWGCYLRCRLDSTSLRGGGDVTYDAGWTVPVSRWDVTYDAGWTVPVSGEVGMLLTMQAGQYQSPGRWGCYLRCRLDSTSLPMGCYLRCRLDSTSLRGGGDVTYDAGWTVPVSRWDVTYDAGWTVPVSGEVGMLLTMQAGQYQSPDGMSSSAGRKQYMWNAWLQSSQSSISSPFLRQILHF